MGFPKSAIAILAQFAPALCASLVAGHTPFRSRGKDCRHSFDDFACGIDQRVGRHFGNDFLPQIRETACQHIGMLVRPCCRHWNHILKAAAVAHRSPPVVHERAIMFDDALRGVAGIGGYESWRQAAVPSETLCK